MCSRFLVVPLLSPGLSPADRDLSLPARLQQASTSCGSEMETGRCSLLHGFCSDLKNQSDFFRGDKVVSSLGGDVLCCFIVLFFDTLFALSVTVWLRMSRKKKINVEEVALTFSAMTSWFKIQLLTTLRIKRGNELTRSCAPNKPARNNAEYGTEMKSLQRNSDLAL